MKKLFIALTMILAVSQIASAQTNFQTFYDLGRKHFTTTLEGFHQDNWGNTFFFIDYDYNNRDGNTIISPSNTYFEIARCLNFWSESALAPLSLQVEYNGGFGLAANAPSYGTGSGFPVNSAFLFGLDWFLHSENFNNTLNLKVLYKQFIKLNSKVPLQFTAVWGFQDLFGLKNLRFSGFVDFWCEGSSLVVLSEPQLWFQVFDHFNIGGEVELSYNFAGMQGFNVLPCIGTKWVF
ncbi:MAG: DUF5020 family protein [Bacteroidales bacterium]|jgi:hypothetical protein|nr:DUF5020 family protein [Bacteroidales bacterium]MBR5671027.1 DUF5020 family protein [Bacteroidales bacterium]